MPASIAGYLAEGVLVSLRLVFFAAGPLLAAAAALHYQAAFIRSRAAGLFGRDLYPWLTAPGVVVHELGHAVFCLLFQHRITGASFFRPEPDGTLGYVSHAWRPANPWQSAGNFFIGTGPVWCAAAVIHLLFQALAAPGAAVVAPELSPGGLAAAGASTAAALFFPGFYRAPRFYFYAWLIFSVGAHATLSRSDLAGTARGALALFALLTAFNWALAWQPGFGAAVTDRASALLAPAAAALAVALLVNGLLCLPLLAAGLFLERAGGGRGEI